MLFLLFFQYSVANPGRIELLIVYELSYTVGDLVMMEKNVLIIVEQIQLCSS